MTRPSPHRVLIGCLLAALGGCATPATPTPAHVPTTGAPATGAAAATATPGVLVRVGAAFTRDSVITATVVNGGPDAVYTEDQKSDCTVTTLEGDQGGTWTPYPTCGQERAPRTVTLAAGEQLTVRIDLSGENFRPQPAGAGAYRLVFGFRRSAQPVGTEPERVTSPEFRID